MRSPRLVVLLLAASVPACAPGAMESSAAPAGSARHILTQAEIQQASLPNAYEAVTALRSHWLLRGRPMVAVDDVVVGGIDELRGISALEVQRLQLLDLKAASLRFGQRAHVSPVILVTLARAAPS